MNTQVLCNKCSQNVKINYCAHCNYKTKRNFDMKRHIGIKHAHIHDQEDVGEDIAEGRVNTPFTEQDELHVKDEVKDPELLEDSIEVLKIYKLLQRMKNINNVIVTNILLNCFKAFLYSFLIFLQIR